MWVLIVYSAVAVSVASVIRMMRFIISFRVELNAWKAFVLVY